MTNSILITGGTGMVGKAIKNFLPKAIYVGSKTCDLRSQKQTENMFENFRPDYVIHLAAKVGGVKGNTDYVADFFTENILINTNVLENAKNFKVKKVVSLLSTCVYPDANYVTYPLTEDQLHLGPPHESNFGYSYAKRMIEVQSRAYNKQYGTNFLCAIPNNIFGEYDLFDLENGHVIPAIIRKIWEAKINNTSVELWGDGSPLREFTYSNDIARALLYLLWNVENNDVSFNIGNPNEYSIKTIAKFIAKEMNYNGKIIWNTNKPAGQFKKPSDNSKFLKIAPDFYYSNFEEMLKKTCDWFKTNYPNVRGMK